MKMVNSNFQFLAPESAKCPLMHVPLCMDIKLGHDKDLIGFDDLALISKVMEWTYWTRDH